MKASEARRYGFTMIEIFGVLILISLMIMLLLPGNFIFGWARPVPVAQRNLRNPRRDMAVVAAAGPAANIAMAMIQTQYLQGELWAEIYKYKDLRPYRRMARAAIRKKPFWTPARARATPPAGV